MQAANRAIAGQLVPVGGLVVIPTNGGRLLRRTGLVFNQPERDRYIVGGAHHDLIDHHDGDGSPGDRVDGDRLFVTGMADHDPLIDLDALIFGGERVQLLDRNAHQQDRLMMLEHIGIDDHALGIEQHLQVDRLAGIGRNIHHIDGLEGIAQHVVILGKRADLIVARWGRHLCAGEELVDALLLERVLLGLQGKDTEHQRQQQDKAMSPGALDASCERERGLHNQPTASAECGADGREGTGAFP